MRVRGDGRTYNINLHTYGEMDITWQDLWMFPLYTRGGPYWQTVKVRFIYMPPCRPKVLQANLNSED
jgi:NADH dehydrogenase [ubiquinone] 1 alpha subcomplex assembly factor 1